MKLGRLEVENLEFDKEFQRVKRFWANQSKAGTLPVMFSKQRR